MVAVEKDFWHAFSVRWFFVIGTGGGVAALLTPGYGL
jgi:hypothetical protein